MMKRVYGIMAFLVISTAGGWAEDIWFEKINEYPLVSTDQQGLTECILMGDSAFLLMHYFRAHSYSRGRYFYKVLLSDKDIYTDFLFPEESWSFSYESNDMVFMEPEERLLDRVVVINEILHLPDASDYSHQFTVKGEYLGRFPDFSKQYMESRPQIVLNGNLMQFPIHILGTEYYDAVITKNVVILVSDNRATILDKKELAEQGDLSSAFSFQLDNMKRLPANSLINVLGDSYILRRKDTTLYNVQSGEKFNAVHNVKWPSGALINWRWARNDLYYHIERSERPYYSMLLEFKIHGLEGLSSIDDQNWRILN